MSEGGIEDAVVKNPVALWSASNDDEEEEDEEEHLAISGTNPLESNGVLTPYLDNENNALQLFQRTSDANQVIGDVNIESSNNVHIGHVFKTIVQGDIQNSSPVNQETNGYCKKVNTCTDVALKKPTDITDILRQKSFKIWSLAFLMVLVVVALSLVFYLPLSLSPNPSSPIIPSSGHSDDLGDGIQIIQRHEWSARDPLNVTKISEPPKIVRIMHTAGFKCNSYQKCATQVLALQGWQVSSQGMPDVAYNYLIGGDGNVYVGRGADVQNEWMPNAIDIVYIGNYLSPYDQLTDKMEKAGRRLIARLRAEGKITQDYVVIAQNQTVNTQSPGENIFKEIIKWPHYDPSIYF